MKKIVLNETLDDDTPREVVEELGAKHGIKTVVMWGVKDGQTFIKGL